MKRKSIIIVVLLCAGIIALWGCGSGPGSPGSSGSENTGIQIESVSIITNKNPGNAGPDLDVNIHICPSSGKPEPGLFRDDATMTITASKLNPTSGFDPFPASVEQCTIVYKQPADELGAPIIEAWTIFPNCTISSGSNPCVVNLIDIDRKAKFWNDFVSGLNDPQKMPTRYVATYDCKYMNNLGESGHFQVEMEIFLADFELCT
jgi:hypothetical protein